MYSPFELHLLPQKHQREILRRRQYRDLKVVEASKHNLALKDRWTPEDYDRDRQLQEHIMSIRALIGQLGSTKYNEDGTNKLTKAELRQQRTRDYTYLRNQELNELHGWKEVDGLLVSFDSRTPEEIEENEYLTRMHSILGSTVRQPMERAYYERWPRILRIINEGVAS